MSIEQLLFFLFLVAFPLLERLVRAMRARTDRSPAERQSAGRGVTASPRPAARSVADAAAEPESARAEHPDREPPLPALPPAIARAEPELGSAPERQRPAPIRQRSKPAAGPHERRPRGPLLARRLLTGSDLSRAVVWTVILGPCRALDPKTTSRLE